MSIEGPFTHAQSPLEQQTKNSYWRPVGEQEERIRRESKSEVDRLERVINLGQRMLTIKNSPGYQQFEEAIRDLRSHAENEMVGCVASNEQLRIFQGRCQAFGSILALMRNTEQNIESLAHNLEVAKEKAASVIRPDGKVVPDPMVGGLL